MFSYVCDPKFPPGDKFVSKHVIGGQSVQIAKDECLLAQLIAGTLSCLCILHSRPDEPTFIRILKTGHNSSIKNTYIDLEKKKTF